MKPYKNQGKFKVGDWVVFNGYSPNYDGRPLQIYKITKDIYLYINEQYEHNGSCKHARYATQKELIKHGIYKIKDDYKMY